MRTTPSWTPAKQRRRHVIPFSQQTNKANTTFRHHPDTIQTPFRHHPDIIQLLSFIHVCSRCPCKIVFWTKLFEINLIVLTWMQHLPYLIRWRRFSLFRRIEHHPIQSGTAPRMRSLCCLRWKNHSQWFQIDAKHHSDIIQTCCRYHSDICQTIHHNCVRPACNTSCFQNSVATLFLWIQNVYPFGPSHLPFYARRLLNLAERLPWLSRATRPKHKPYALSPRP